MRQLRRIAAAAICAAALGLGAAPAPAQVYYTINGRPAPPDVQRYMAANRLPPGHYWLNPQGYWGVVGNPRPLGNIYAGSYVSRNGSGERAANGWSHYNNLDGFSVGGDNNGCYYAGSWSNC
jgi:hypothetical protein